MSILEGIIEESQATGDVAQVYEKAKARFGFVPNAMKMQSINPDTIKFFAGLSHYFVAKSSLSEKFRLIANEMIAKKDDCEYCMTMMQGALNTNFGITKDDINEFIDDPKKAPLEEKEIALLEFILKALEDSNSTSKDDITKLNDLGVSDMEIFDAINFATQMQKIHIMLNVFRIDKD